MTAKQAQAVQFFRCDAVIVTGSMTGKLPNLKDVIAAREAVDLPVEVGSGITPENLHHYHQAADGFIVGSSLKQDGHWTKPVDPGRVVYWWQN